MAGAVRQSGAVHVQVVGAGALNQAIKALAIARGFVQDAGIDLICAPSFADVVIDGEERTAIRLEIEQREIADDPDQTGGRRDLVPADN
jgi:stage V sporulation protein S